MIAKYYKQMLRIFLILSELLQQSLQYVLLASQFECFYSLNAHIKIEYIIIQGLKFIVYFFSNIYKYSSNIHTLQQAKQNQQSALSAKLSILKSKFLSQFNEKTFNKEEILIYDNYQFKI
ncbi:hypothetical protein ABPG72_014150 [Tetrahymena utriculariae]